MPKSDPVSPVPGTPRSDAGSAIAHGPFAAEVEKVPCPVRETFDWTDVRGIRKRPPIRPPVEQNWHTDVTEAVTVPPLPLLIRGEGFCLLLDGVLTRSFFDITIVTCAGCFSVRQVVWSLNNIPENNAIVGELVFAFKCC